MTSVPIVLSKSADKTAAKEYLDFAARHVAAQEEYVKRELVEKDGRTELALTAQNERISEQLIPSIETLVEHRLTTKEDCNAGRC